MLRKGAYDVVVVGGGVMGSSIAYHLSLSNTLKVAVIEKDPRYAHASAMLSAGGIRQQFSIEENVKMSMYGAEFLKHPERLAINGAVPDFQFRENGYLFLSTPNGMKTMEQTNLTQKNAGAAWIDLLTPEQLSHKFPWLNASGIALGSLGTQCEGYFDPWSLLSAMKLKAIESGVEYLNGEVTDATISSNPLSDELMIEKLTVTGNDLNESLTCGTVVNACGPWAGKFMEQIASQCPSPDLVHQLPVKPRKRSIFLFHCQTTSIETETEAAALMPPVTAPLTIDPSGVYFRPEGHSGKFICGVSPLEDPDCESTEDLRNCDPHLFDEIIWPTLYERVPAFGEIKVKSSWSGFYEYNTVDQNAIIGKHPNFQNLMLCNGFSGHGLQQSPAAGRAISELILEKKFQTIDLGRLSFERIRLNTPLFEDGIV